jgi:hypothetical protein
MILIWLLFWFLHGTPALHEWNDWLVTLVISVVLA